MPWDVDADRQFDIDHGAADDGRVDGAGDLRLDFVDSDVLANICAEDVAPCFGDTPTASPSSERIEGTGANVGIMMETLENGSGAAPADQSALDLGIPTLDDIDPALLGVTSCAAENGLIGCEQP